MPYPLAAARGRSVHVAATGGSAGWWDASATIPAGNILEHLDDVTPGTASAGGDITKGNAFTVAVRLSAATTGGTDYVFDAVAAHSSAGAVCIVWRNSLNRMDYRADGTLDSDTGAGSYPTNFIYVCNGTGTTVYRDGTLVSTIADAGACTALYWGTETGGSGLTAWDSNLVYAAYYDIALDAGQIAALDASMSA